MHRHRTDASPAIPGHVALGIVEYWVARGAWVALGLALAATVGRTYAEYPPPRKVS